MGERLVSFRDRVESLSEAASSSAEGARLVLLIFGMAGYEPDPRSREEISTAGRRFLEIRANARMMLERKIPSDQDLPSKTDMVLLRNLAASFSRQSIDYIVLLTGLARDPQAGQAKPFIVREAGEQRKRTESVYPVCL